jgi:hypothetical protein
MMTVRRGGEAWDGQATENETKNYERSAASVRQRSDFSPTLTN